MGSVRLGVFAAAFAARLLPIGSAAGGVNEGAGGGRIRFLVVLGNRISVAARLDESEGTREETMSRTLEAAIYLLLATALLACGADTGGTTNPGDPAGGALPEGDPTPTQVSDYLVTPSKGGKTDTGYLSNLASEVEGTFRSTLVVDGRDMEEEDRAAYVERLKESSTVIQGLADRQLKFAKNQINASRLHLNLTSSDAVAEEVEADEVGLIRVRYSATVESTVTEVELAEDNLSLADVVGQSFQAVLPIQPDLMADKVGTACLEDGHEAHGYNYFYYYQPDREGCAEAMEQAGIERVQATFEVASLAPSKTVYPEYDQLVADKQIDVVVFFGAAKDQWEPGDWDWGVYSARQFARDLEWTGFEEEEAEQGRLFTRTSGDILEKVRLVGPETLKLLKEDDEGLFAQLVSENEVIMYNGHSFYGSLDVLDDPAIFPGSYQIFFMNSCWSYEYYTKQIFRANESEEDPEGWLLADIVNNTEVGWFHNMGKESSILLANLLEGARNGGVDGDRYFTWDRIIAAMNTHALESYESRSTETHEIYGVSGVRTNSFDTE
jgi:hypothetical protein